MGLTLPSGALPFSLLISHQALGSSHLLCPSLFRCIIPFPDSELLSPLPRVKCCFPSWVLWDLAPPPFSEFPNTHFSSAQYPLLLSPEHPWAASLITLWGFLQVHQILETDPPGGAMWRNQGIQKVKSRKYFIFFEPVLSQILANKTKDSVILGNELKMHY